MTRRQAYPLTGALCALMVLTMSACTVRFHPIVDVATPKTDEGAENVAAVFFDDDYGPGCYTYSYPVSSSSRIQGLEDEVKVGEAALEVVLDVDQWSGAAIGFGSAVDLADCYEHGVLQFWIKGETGTERGKFKLQDDDARDGHKAGVGMSFADIGLGSEWKLVTIPLKQLGRRGKYWDGTADVMVDFEWDRVKEFVVSGDAPGKNPSFRVWLDEVRVLKKDPTRRLYEWREERNIPADAVAAVFVERFVSGARPAYHPRDALFIPAEGRGYDSRYALEISLPSADAVGEVAVREPWKLGPVREAGALDLWIRGERGGESIVIELVDGPGIDGVESVAGIEVGSGDVSTSWRHLSLPLSEFTRRSGWFEWNNVRKLRVTAPAGSEETTLWLDNVVFTRKATGNERVSIPK